MIVRLWTIVTNHHEKGAQQPSRRSTRPPARENGPREHLAPRGHDPFRSGELEGRLRRPGDRALAQRILPGRYRTNHIPRHRPGRCHPTLVMTAVVSTASTGLRDQPGVSFVPGGDGALPSSASAEGRRSGRARPTGLERTPMRSHTQFPAGKLGRLISFLPAPDRCWLVPAAAGL
jgi:hypothetical protein